MEIQSDQYMQPFLKHHLPGQPEYELGELVQLKLTSLAEHNLLSQAQPLGTPELPGGAD